mmetsp:Transcript_5437/g.16632  ORF Transcript_5437/g.16632 Transcript_5437/m.16632 type:complete len:91 (+) Transcript_5437:513-785(+)
MGIGKLHVKHFLAEDVGTKLGAWSWLGKSEQGCIQPEASSAHPADGLTWQHTQQCISLSTEAMKLRPANEILLVQAVSRPTSDWIPGSAH